MIDLVEVSGLPIKFDEERGKFIFGEELICSMEHHVALSEIVPILLNKYLKYPEVVYKHNKIYAKDWKVPTNISYDLIYIPYGLLGIEYVKTHVYYSDYAEGKYDAIVEVLHGELTVIIQKNQEKEDIYQFDTYVDELHIVNLKRGHKLAIPTGVFYTFVNTGMTPLIIAKVSSNNHREIDYNMLKREKGLACYIISKNAKIETVANPKYKMPYKLKTLTVNQFLEKKSSEKIYVEISKSKEPLSRIMAKVIECF